MENVSSTKPYLIRAVHEWCVDNGFTPHLLVTVDENTRVPMAYVKNGEIVLNINYSATKDLVIDNTAISFSARFSGASQNIYVPIGAVRGIFARENSQGMFFEAEPVEDKPDQVSQSEAVGKPQAPKEVKKPSLTLVKKD
ncbi:ClpXP protease specificity-enhancing factor [Methylovorus glucosotrophus]|uniref:Stringent starvation protein B n=1 Tax=Methylovorus glucosotrophus (strain SIP3-4) TaxID=582744 RepID=C6X8R5_METGS|nr:ClpXP protease specificity-enhancing factor [Methylovorus glucosotrophus]ACT49535.1 Stringent starvation protein B [Methylovorus glucosotrophus SIP3-4]